MSERPQEAFKQREVQATRGVKLSNDSSKVAKRARDKREEEKTFEQRAEQLINEQNSQLDAGLQIAKEFLDAVRSKVLPSNRGTLGDGHEKMLRDRFVALVTALNNDPNERFDGTGSSFALKVIMRVALLQRDRINELEYRLQELEKKVSRLGAEKASDV